MAQQEEYRATVPDTIVGIGGGGKKVVYELLQSDWILKEALEPRPDNDNPGFNPYIVDSETVHNDDTRIEEINDYIEEKTSEWGHQGNTTEVKYINPVENTSDVFQSTVGMTHQGAVQEIAQAANLRSWWLSESPEMLGANDSYAEGVERRRGLSKALYHASQTQTDPLSEITTNPGNSVYLVVGLGGGTGSGMFIDIAKRLNQESDVDIYLFGILPGGNAGNQESANTHAALSELEYLSLTNENPFTNIVLLPFAAADDAEEFDEAAVNAIMSHANIARDGLVNNQAMYLEPGDNNGLYKYAPFTLAVPKTFHYDAPEIQDAEDEIRDYVEDLDGVLDTEFEMYESVKLLLSSPEEHTDSDRFDKKQLSQGIKNAAEALSLKADGGSPKEVYNTFSLDQKEAEALDARLKGIREILTIEMLDDLNMQSHLMISNELDVAVEEAYEGDLNDLPTATRVEHILDSVGAVFDGMSVQEQLMTMGDGEVDELDREFGEAVVRHLLAISKRADILRALHLLEDDRALRKGLRGVLNPSIERPGQVSSLESSRSDLVNDRREAESKLDILDEAKDNAEEKSEDLLEDWRLEVQQAVENLIEIDRNFDEIDSEINTLINDIKQAISDLSGDVSTRPPHQPLGYSDFSRLNNLLQRAGVDRIESQKIETSFKNLSKMRRAQIDKEEGNDGILGGVLNRNADDPEQAFTDAEPQVDPEYFNVSADINTNLNPVFNAEQKLRNKISAIEEEREKHVRTITEALGRETREPLTLEELLEDPSVLGSTDLSLSFGIRVHETEFEDRLNNQLTQHRFDEQSVDQILRELTTDNPDENELDNVVYQAVQKACITPIEEATDDSEEKLTEAKSGLVLYNRTIELIKNAGKSYTNRRAEELDLDISFDRVESESSVFRDRISPDERGRMAAAQDLGEADVFNIEAERTKLKIRFHNQVNELSSNKELLPINQLKLERTHGAKNSSNTGLPEYDGQKVKTVYMSRAFEGTNFPKTPQGDGFFDGETHQEFQDRIKFASNNEGYGEFRLGYGAPWDISMTTFVGGVFLDNLAPVGQAINGYLAAYESQENKYQENIRIRHVHGVDGHDSYISLEDGEGMFIVRKSLVSMNSDEVNLFIDNTESEVADLLLDHVSVSKFKSTIDLS